MLLNAEGTVLGMVTSNVRHTPPPNSDDDVSALLATMRCEFVFDFRNVSEREVLSWVITGCDEEGQGQAVRGGRGVAG
jgi:hypothetical protein